MLGYLEQLHHDPTFLSLPEAAKKRILETIGATEDMAEKDMCELVEKESRVLLREFADRLTNIEARIFDRGGDPGHISQTNKQFETILEKMDKDRKEQKKDLHEGIKTLHVALDSIDKTVQFALKEQNKKIESHDTRIDDHETRLTVAEKTIVTIKGELANKERKDEQKSNRKFQWYHGVGSGFILLIAGALLGRII